MRVLRLRSRSQPAQALQPPTPRAPFWNGRTAKKAGIAHLPLRLPILNNRNIRSWVKLCRWKLLTASVSLRDVIREREVTVDDSKIMDQEKRRLYDLGGSMDTEYSGQSVALDGQAPSSLPATVPDSRTRDVEVSGRPRGLRNRGSSCYMNSMLQVLHGNPSFRRTLQEAVYLKWGNTTSHTSSDRCTTVAYELEGLFQQMAARSNRQFWHGYGHGDLVNPTAFITAWQLHRGACDSALFFTRLMEALDEALGAQIAMPFTLTSAFVFEDVRDPRVRLERMNPGSLMLQVESECLPSVQAGLDAYFAAEQVEKTLQGSVRLCHRRTWLLGPLPSILIIQLNQPHPPMWDYGYQYQKRRSDVTQIPRTVDLAPYVWHDPSQPPLGQCVYELSGVVVHSSFHYYAFVRRNGRWWKCNDASVMEVTAREVHREASGANLVSKALLLLYSRRPEAVADMQQTGDRAPQSARTTAQCNDEGMLFEPEF